MLIAVAIGIVLILIVVSIMRGKEKPEIIEEDYVPVYDDEDLAYLKVFYKYNEIQQGQIITTYEKNTCFKVEGYNKDDYRKVLYPEKTSWSSG
jgi:hypothetical protein